MVVYGKTSEERDLCMNEKVYRTELTPVSFLKRSAYMFPDKEAVVYGDRRYTYEDYIAEGSPDPVESVLEDEEEMISVNYTSGTTGQPKGVMYNHRNAYISALGNVIETQMNYETRYLWTLPMFHCNGWTYPWAVTAVAGTHVCLRKVEPDKIWDLFETERITHYCAAPTVQIPLANSESGREL